MPSMFHGNQTDYIAKLNILASDTVSVSVNAAVGGTTTLDCSLGSNFHITMGAGNTTIAFSNVPTIVGFVITVFIKKDNSGTQRSVTWPASVVWPAANTPILTNVANATDIFEFKSIDSGTKYFGRTYGLNYA